MTERRHQYRASLEWSDPRGVGTVRASTHSRNHVVRIAGKPDLLLTADPSFRGDPALQNPEELLLISLSSCHMLWYLGLCARAGVEVTRYVDDAEATMVEQGAAGGHFERVLLHPRVTIKAGDPVKARELHRDAHRCCYVANSVNFPVEYEPTIEIGP